MLELDETAAFTHNTFDSVWLDAYKDDYRK